MTLKHRNAELAVDNEVHLLYGSFTEEGRKQNTQNHYEAMLPVQEHDHHDISGIRTHNV